MTFPVLWSDLCCYTEGWAGWEMLGDISYDVATLQFEGKKSIHIHIHNTVWGEGGCFHDAQKYIFAAVSRHFCHSL